MHPVFVKTCVVPVSARPHLVQPGPFSTGINSPASVPVSGFPECFNQTDFAKLADIFFNVCQCIKIF